MGFFDALRRILGKRTETVKILSGGVPIYSLFGRDVYMADAVKAAINCIATEMLKLKPQHTRKGMNDFDTQLIAEGSIQRVLERPNPYMTTPDFIEKIIWRLFFDFNAFIIPAYDVVKAQDGTISRRYTGLFPITPSGVEFIEDASNTIYVKFKFPNNFETTYPYSDVIHIRHRFSLNEFMGGNEWGLPDNEALEFILGLEQKMLTGISMAMESSSNLIGAIKYNTILDGDKMDAAIKDFQDRLKKNESGLLPLDLKGEFIPFKRDVKFVDADTLKFIDERILRQFGVSLAILIGDYTKEQYEAFSQRVLEPLIKKLTNAFTDALFTDRERGFGNRITFFQKELVFLTVDQKLELIHWLGDAGTLYENEKRVMFGLAPLPELVGVRKQSLNYVDSDYAKEYQLNNKGGNNNGQANQQASN